MHAVILAGGKGARLRPYTTVLPKPLMPIGDMPILEVVLRQLRKHGFTRVTMAVSYLAELIEAYCGDGARFGLEIAYSREPKELSTAGPLKLVPDLSGTFLAMNGDILTNLDFSEMVRVHRKKKAAATIAVHRRTVTIDYGVIETDEERFLARYIEKPEYHYLVSMGIYVLEPQVLDHIGHEEALGIPDLMLRLKDSGHRVATYEPRCLWLDIGRPSDHERAVEMFDDLRAGLVGDS
jgi:NDP-sugar pyrophosphorylase family protein